MNDSHRKETIFEMRLKKIIAAIAAVATIAAFATPALAEDSPVAVQPNPYGITAVDDNDKQVPLNVQKQGASARDAAQAQIKYTVDEVYDIAPASAVAGSVVVGIPYSASVVKPAIYHYENNAWKALTTTPQNGVAYAYVTSFSPFAVVDKNSPVAGTGTPSGSTSPTNKGDYTVIDALGAVISGNVVTAITNSDTIEASKKMMQLTGSQKLEGLYNFKPTSGVAPYTLKINIGKELSGAEMYVLSDSSWTKIASTYDDSTGVLSALLRSADAFAIVTTPGVTASVILPAGTKYYAEVPNQPGVPGQEYTLAYSTEVVMGKAYPTGYTEITLSGIKYLIKGSGVSTPANPSAPVTPVNPGAAGGTTPTSPKTGDDTPNLGVLIAIMLGSAASACVAFRRALVA